MPTTGACAALTQERHQQRHQHIAGAGHVHRQVRRGPAPDLVAADRQGHQFARHAGHRMRDHPLRAALKQHARSGDGVVLA